MMNQVIDKLAEIIATPEVILLVNSVSARKPSRSSEVPAITVSLVLEQAKGNGTARFIRAGDALVQSTTVVEVKASPETFATDLKTLRISSLPLRKNPASVPKAFTEQDVQIQNVSDPAQPMAYYLVEKPSQQNEYRLDVSRALILFGRPQTEGDKVELVHWTVEWRDEITATRYSGIMTMELWANSFEQSDTLGRQVQTRLASNRALLREKGFLLLQPVQLEPVENVQLTATPGSPFPAWRQKLAYRFAFEAEEGGELSGGGPIKRIDVDMDEEVIESFKVP